jgi:hypothetical protein
MRKVVWCGGVGVVVLSYASSMCKHMLVEMRIKIKTREKSVP